MGKVKSEAEKQATRDARNARRRDKRAAQALVKEAEAVVEEAITKEAGIVVGSLAIGTKFTLDGNIYKVHSVGAPNIIADRLENTPIGVMVERDQRPISVDTEVKLVD
ncbi:MAG: hypothetical protein PHQ43_14585 [Dehalococcoidales bacterium]|nr:hypothetical protein [Dehalococcoidales bacterium]